jgi:hypothetical protein
MTIIFYIAAGIVLLALLVTVMLPELPLSRQSAVQRNAGDGAGPAGSAPAARTATDDAVAIGGGAEGGETADSAESAAGGGA